MEHAILEAAEDRFTRLGYRATTVEDIAEAADVSVGSIYFHFDSKQGLYLAVVERALELNERYMYPAREVPGPPIERLLAAADAFLRFYLDHPGQFRLLVFPHVDAADGDELPDAAAMVARRVERMHRRLARAIEDAIESGAIRRGVEPHHAARFLWASWSGVIALNVRRDGLHLDEESMRDVLHEGTRIMVEGLAPAELRDENAELRADLARRLNSVVRGARPTRS